MTPFGKAYQQTGYGEPEGGVSEAETYEHALEFLDRFIEEASERGLSLRHRLEAQSLLWVIQDEEPASTVAPVENDETATKVPQSLDELASDLMWEPDRLRMIIHGLEDKGQVIFQGPPGHRQDLRGQAHRPVVPGTGRRLPDRTVPPVIYLRGLRGGFPARPRQ